MDYLDFELEIGPGSGREYPVAVFRSPAGEARETMRFPFGELELDNKLQALQIALLRSGGQRRQSLSPEQRTVQDFGRALFDALLTGEVRVRYDVSQERAMSQGKGLRLKLRVNAPEMAALPWEFLYDPRRAEYVCLSQETPIVRYLELPQPIQPLIVTPPLRILGMVASPSDAGDLNVDVEKQRVETALRDLQADGLVELTWLEGQTWRALQQAMRRGQWHVFHFIGHGDFDAGADEGLLLFCGDDGRVEKMHAAQLARLLANAPGHSLRLALLNACESGRGSARDLFSSTASILVRRGIPAVLAMQYAVTDRAAIEFARTFYESLVDGLPVDAAVVESRVAISLAVHNTVEWGTPVLYMRSPDGVLFKMQEAGGKKQDAGGKTQDGQQPASITHPVSSIEQPASSPQEFPSSTGLSGALVRRLREALPRCGAFDSDRALRVVFVDARLSVWRNQIPQAANVAGRVQAVIDEFFDRFNAAGENALVLLVQVLRDLTDPGDALYRQLEVLAAELADVLQSPVGAQRSAVARPPFEPEMILIPVGEFWMGSDPQKDKNAPDSEQPQHTLNLPNYYIAKTPVTNAQYMTFVVATGYRVPRHWQNGKIPSGEDMYPVVYVTWDDAMAYCKWLAEATGKPYTLPSEAEWEKAARGMDGWLYPWGNTFDKSKCNVKESGIGRTTPVDKYPQGASPYGVLDMAGNVWEWTRSLIKPYLYDPADGREDLDLQGLRVLRGGCWFSGRPAFARCAYRGNNNSVYRNDDLGFRIVRGSL